MSEFNDIFKDVIDKFEIGNDGNLHHAVALFVFKKVKSMRNWIHFYWAVIVMIICFFSLLGILDSKKEIVVQKEKIKLLQDSMVVYHKLVAMPCIAPKFTHNDTLYLQEMEKTLGKMKTMDLKSKHKTKK